MDFTSFVAMMIKQKEKDNMTLLEEKYLLLSNIVLISNK